jgi:hypothetical protein
MPTTKDSVYSEFKSRFTALTHEETDQSTLTPDSQGKVSRKNHVIHNTITPDIEAIAKTIIEVIVDKIEWEGLKMGQSTATKMDVS